MAAETIHELLELQAQRFGEAPFLGDGEEWLSYARLAADSGALAAGLQALGLGKGDRIALLSENRLAMVETLFACFRAGLVLVPLNAYLRGDFLRYQLEDSGASAVVADARGLSAIEALDPPIALRQLIVMDAQPEAGSRACSLAQVRGAGGVLAGPALRAGDLAAIVYTSGTTGMPKGCMIPHGMFTRIFQVYRDSGFIQAGDRLLTPSPIFHMGFLGGMLGPALAVGASLCVLPEFRASTFMATARAVGATVVYGVGSVGMLLLAQPPAADDRAASRLRVMLLPPMPPASQEDFEARFGVPVVAENYGQTECMPISLANVGEPRRRGSAGQPASVVEVMIVDDSDEPLPPDTVGEIVLRPREPHSMFQGYWNNPEATAEAERGLWHHTGDIGRQSHDGTLWVVDRKKDAIRRRGENVSSAELEAAIARHPDIAQVAVHAVPGEAGDDEIKACLVLRAGASIGAQELFGFFRRAVPYFAVPRYVELMDELPVNAVGRVRKQLLRDRGIGDATWDFRELGLVIGRQERRAGQRAVR